MGWATYWAIFHTNSSGHPGGHRCHEHLQVIKFRWGRVARFFLVQHTKTGENIPIDLKIYLHFASQVNPNWYMYYCYEIFYLATLLRARGRNGCKNEILKIVFRGEFLSPTWVNVR
jgi:hypothetical protein